jgi:hypothetical protein
MRRDGHVACTERRNVNTFVQGKLEGKINEPMRDLVNTVMNLWVPQKKEGHFLTSYPNVMSE